MSDRRLEWAGLLVVTVLGTAVALTRNPEGVVVERAKRWPGVGAWAERLQERFRKPRPAPPAPPVPVEVVILRLTVPEPPSPPAAGRPRATGRAPERRAAAPIDRTPVPTLPLDSEPADAAQLARAVGLLGDAARATTLGPYALVADFDPPGRWGELAAALDAGFTERIGLAPRGVPRETVVAYRDRATYRALQRLEPRLAGLDPAGHAAGGLAAIAAGQPASAAAEATLVHELVHFVERRALGPELPPWLAEGLAEDLAWTPFESGIGFRWGELRRGILRKGSRIEIAGAVAGLEELANAVDAGEAPGLAELVVLDDRRFAAGADAPRRYAQALWWVRFLLDGDSPVRAEGLRRYLADIATGGAADLAALERALGEDLTALEPEFRVFLLAKRGLEIDDRLAALARPGERVVLTGRQERPPPL